MFCVVVVSCVIVALVFSGCFVCVTMVVRASACLSDNREQRWEYSLVLDIILMLVSLSFTKYYLPLTYIAMLPQRDKI